MRFAPVTFVKQHPVGTVTCILIGWFGPKWSGMVPGVRVRGGGSAGVTD